MAINYPTTLDNFTSTQTTQTTDTPANAGSGTGLSPVLNNLNDAVTQLEAKVGINSSAVTTTLDYKLSGVTGSDKATDNTTFKIDHNAAGTHKIGVVDAERYAADAGSTDDYVITLTPAPAAYATGMYINFKPNTSNTGACTINVNSLGAKNIKYNAADPLNNTLVAGNLYTLAYDGTNFQILTPTAQPYTAPITWTPSPTGFSSVTVTRSNYLKIGLLVWVDIAIAGTSNNASFQFTLPFTAANTTYTSAGRCVDNSVAQTTTGLIRTNAASATADVFKLADGTTFTNANTKQIDIAFWYQATT